MNTRTDHQIRPLILVGSLQTLREKPGSLPVSVVQTLIRYCETCVKDKHFHKDTNMRVFPEDCRM